MKWFKYLKCIQSFNWKKAILFFVKAVDGFRPPAILTNELSLKRLIDCDYATGIDT